MICPFLGEIIIFLFLCLLCCNTVTSTERAVHLYQAKQDSARNEPATYKGNSSEREIEEYNRIEQFFKDFSTAPFKWRLPPDAAFF